MPRESTTYDLLISCPSDVKQEIKLIKEVVENFNKLYGDANNIQINVKHWSTDAYPQSGGKPQDLLNKQLINKCDAAIAVFWTRFGTPTDKYQSGSEEEIEEMIKSGKQVFLYFSNKVVNLEKVDLEQYNKVCAFKEKYKYKGIYWTYSSNREFKSLLLNHLIFYFLQQVPKNKVSLRQPNLIVKGVINDKPCDEIYIHKCKFLESEYIKVEEEQIRLLIDEIKGINISEYTKYAADPHLEYEELVVGEQEIEIIENYTREHNIEIPNGFFYIGHIWKHNNKYIGLGLLPPYIDGSEQEKKKLKLIGDLYKEINKYNEIYTFYSDLSNKLVVQLVVCNIGQTFDEDIDVQLKMKKGSLCKPFELPIPGPLYINDFNENSIGEYIYKIRKGVSIDEYSNYGLSSSEYDIDIPSLSKRTKEDEYKKEVEKYKERIEDIFCYEFFEEEGYEILSFNISYLKQNTNMAIPSLLFFRMNPKKISYEIKSKHSPSVFSGELDILEE